MPRFISLLLLFCVLCFSTDLRAIAARKVNERRAAQAGIRRIDSRHLRLYTDLEPGDAVDGLGNVFDQAVQQWAEYFGIPINETSRWRMQGFLIQERAKFSALGLMPEMEANFANGYCQDDELWFVDQPSDYYRRHLLLHEGTHGFMYKFVGQDAPGWYMEGMAELLGTHRWAKGQLTLRYFPRSREETPMWGRIKLIQDSKPLPVEAVMALRQGRSLSTDEYAWCWALCKFLDSHSRWQERFRKAPDIVGKRDFNKRFRRILASDWSDLQFDWQTFVASLDYGYDLPRMEIEHATQHGNPRDDSCEVSAERGWQDTGWILLSGQKYAITSNGRYTIARDPEPWPCEPGGVTLQYHDGQPLGKLMGVLRPIRGSSDFPKPIAIGLGATISPEEDSILFLRVNESAGHLSDNEGQLQVRCELLSTAGVGD